MFVHIRQSFSKFCIVPIIILMVVFTACGRETSWQQRYDLGVKYLSEYKYEQAVLAFTAAIELNEEASEAYNGRAQAYLALEQYTEAADDYTTLIARDNTDAALYEARGKIYLLLDQPELAMEDFLAVIALNGAYSEELQNLLEEKGLLTSSPLADVSWAVEPRTGFDVKGMLYTLEMQQEQWVVDHFEDYTVVNTGYYVGVQDGRYGLLDLSGNWVVAPEYTVIGHGVEGYYFFNGSSAKDLSWDAKVLTLRNDSTLTYEYFENVVPADCSIIPFTILWDEQGKTFIEPYFQDVGYRSDVEFTTICGIPKAEFTVDNFGGEIVAAQEDGLYALAANSTLLTDFVYEDTGLFHDGLLAVKQNGKWGYVDSLGQTVIPCEYEAFRPVEDFAEVQYLSPAECTDGFVVLFDGEQYALYSSTGETVIPFGVYEELTEVHNGYLWAKENGAWGVLKLGS